MLLSPEFTKLRSHNLLIADAGNRVDQRASIEGRVQKILPSRIVAACPALHGAVGFKTRAFR